jgi:glutamate formiminotransferase / 5-formyltetrahydrofolate cyclo-ligase
VDLAREVARAVRESSGGLPCVRAIGVALPSQQLAQVSLNLLDHRVTPIPVAWDRVVAEARRRDVGVRRAELVGLAPRAAFAGRAPDSVGLAQFTDDRLLDVHMARVTR